MIRKPKLTPLQRKRLGLRRYSNGFNPTWSPYQERRWWVVTMRRAGKPKMISKTSWIGLFRWEAQVRWMGKRAYIVRSEL